MTEKTRNKMDTRQVERIAEYFHVCIRANVVSVERPGHAGHRLCKMSTNSTVFFFYSGCPIFVIVDVVMVNDFIYRK